MRCIKCGERLVSQVEQHYGRCAHCYVASWSEEKRKAFDRLIGLALCPTLPSKALFESALEDAFKHLYE